MVLLKKRVFPDPDFVGVDRLTSWHISMSSLWYNKYVLEKREMTWNFSSARCQPSNEKNLSGDFWIIPVNFWVFLRDYTEECNVRKSFLPSQRLHQWLNRDTALDTGLHVRRSIVSLWEFGKQHSHRVYTNYTKQTKTARCERTFKRERWVITLPLLPHDAKHGDQIRSPRLPSNRTRRVGDSLEIEKLLSLSLSFSLLFSLRYTLEARWTRYNWRR